MRHPATTNDFARPIVIRFGWPLLALLVLTFLAWPAKAQQMPAETVGRLAGDDVSVLGAVTFDVENGRSTAVLASGSDITVRSGQARIELVSGGEIDICGPAHLSVLKSGGAITLALDYGRVRPQLDATVHLTVYTPLIVATPMAIGNGARDVTVGLDQQGEMCAIAEGGAVRIEQQLSGQSLLVPQGGEVNLSGSQLSALRNSTGACSCQLMVAKTTAPKQFEVSVPVHPSTQPPKTPAPAPPPTEEPIYHVYMPPLTFDASAPAPPPEPDPQTIVLVREARLRPDVVFQGHVEAGSATPPRAAVKGDARVPPGEPAHKKPGIWARFFGIFRGHKANTPCAGAGCGSDGS